MTEPSLSAIQSLLDHSLLKPTLTVAELEAGCREAVLLGVASVCILPYFVERCAALLAGSSTLPTTTLGFPHGALPLSAKLSELGSALDAGAREIDVVVNLSLVASREFGPVEREVRELSRACHDRGARIKVIFETCYLEQDQKIALCEICGAAGVDWVKTSTGFGAGGATPEDIRLLREHSPETVQVKASGGIRDLASVLVYRDLGATRIGTSASREILQAARARFG